MRLWIPGLVALVVAGSLPAQGSSAARAHRVDHVDEYHGVRVADPYRWMEEMKSPQVLRWVRAQDQRARGLAGSIADRSLIRDRLQALMDNGRVLLPSARGDRVFLVESGGGLEAPRLVLSLSGDEPRVVVDPMELDPSGGIRVTRMQPSDDARYLAYGVVATGSRWETWRVLDLETGDLLPDSLTGLHQGSSGLINWLPDNSGFYYERFPTPEPGQELSHLVQNEVLLFHRLGTSQTEDRVVLDPDTPDTGLITTLSRDGRYLVVQVGEGGAPENEVHYLDRQDGELRQLIPQADAGYYFLGMDGRSMLFMTNHRAPNWKVIAVSLDRPALESWRDVIPEREFPIDPTVGAAVLGDKIAVAYRRDARLEAYAYDFDGSEAYPIDLRDGGETWSFRGRPGDRYAYYRLFSVVDPGSLYRLDTRTGETTLFIGSELPYDASEFVTRQVFYHSRDGTRVPMFLVHQRGLQLDGANPVFMYGYGAFNWAAAPWFQPKVAVWLQLGGVYALPNIRGGGEYGETWHQAGVRRNKQNSIDDFIAAGKWLIDRGYTSADLLVGNGGSASGPLIAAALVQRPDLFRAAVIDFPALDMLRLEAFSGGRRWRSDFGSVEDEADFRALLAYSPYHNVEPACYPATIVTPGELDESTVPMHAYKFVAALQHAQTCDQPILLRVSWGAGHSSGATPEQSIDNWADQLALLSDLLDIEVAERLRVTSR